MKRLKLTNDNTTLESSTEDLNIEQIENNLSSSCERFDIDPEDRTTLKDLQWMLEEYQDGPQTANADPKEQIVWNQIHAFPSEDGKSIVELHLHVDMGPTFRFTNVIKMLKLMKSDGVLHIHLNAPDGMSMFDAMGFIQIPTFTNATVKYHIGTLSSVSLLTAALQSDEIHLSEFSQILLDHSEEFSHGRSLQDSLNSATYMRDMVKENLDELKEKGILSEEECEEYMEHDRALVLNGVLLKDRIRNYVKNK